MKVYGERKIFGMSQRRVLAVMCFGLIGAVLMIVLVDAFLKRAHRVPPAVQKEIDDRIEEYRRLAATRSH